MEVIIWGSCFLLAMPWVFIIFVPMITLPLGILLCLFAANQKSTFGQPLTINQDFPKIQENTQVLSFVKRQKPLHSKNYNQNNSRGRRRERRRDHIENKDLSFLIWQVQMLNLRSKKHLH